METNLKMGTMACIQWSGVLEGSYGVEYWSGAQTLILAIYEVDVLINAVAKKDQSRY